MTLFFPKKILRRERGGEGGGEKRLESQFPVPHPGAGGSPAVLPGVADVLQLAVPHVGDGEDEDVLVGVGAFPQLCEEPSAGSAP